MSEMAKDETIRFRVPASVKRSLTSAAEERGVTLSEWVREIVLSAVTPPTDKEADVQDVPQATGVAPVAPSPILVMDEAHHFTDEQVAEFSRSLNDVKLPPIPVVEVDEDPPACILGYDCVEGEACDCRAIAEQSIEHDLSPEEALATASPTEDQNDALLSDEAGQTDVTAVPVGPGESVAVAEGLSADGADTASVDVFPPLSADVSLPSPALDGSAEVPPRQQLGRALAAGGSTRGEGHGASAEPGAGRTSPSPPTSSTPERIPWLR